MNLKSWQFTKTECEMNKLFSESRISLTEAAQFLGVNVSTCWRWALKGVRNIRLETCSVGGKRQTSLEAIERFVEATSKAAGCKLEAAPNCTARRRERDIKRDEKYLDNENC